MTSVRLQLFEGKLHQGLLSSQLLTVRHCQEYNCQSGM